MTDQRQETARGETRDEKRHERQNARDTPHEIRERNRGSDDTRTRTPQHRHTCTVTRYHGTFNDSTYCRASDRGSSKHRSIIAEILLDALMTEINSRSRGRSIKTEETDIAIGMHLDTWTTGTWMMRVEEDESRGLRCEICDMGS